MRSILWTPLCVLAFASCGKSTARTKAPDADSASMANMPGMATSTKGDSTAMPRGGNAATASKDSAGGIVPDHIVFTAQQIQHGGIRWNAAVMQKAAITATVPGELIPNEDRTARLGAAARGRIVDVRVQPGDRVTKGQTLVTLQSSDAGMAQSDVAKATAEVTARRAQAQYAASARARAERLLALTAIPRQDYERALADDEQARAALQQGEAESRRAHSTAEQLGATASAAGEIVIRSPLDGVVLSRTAAPGTVVDAGALLIVVTDPATLWLRVNAPEQFASLFHRGDALRFTVPAYPTDTFSARIDAVGAGLDADTHTLGVRGVVSSAGKLKAQMLATVTVGGAARIPAVQLPDEAVVMLQGRPTVFIVKPDGKGGAQFERRAVEVSGRVGGRAAVTRGLVAGDLVVTGGAFAVKGG